MADFRVADLKAWRLKFDITQKRLSTASAVSAFTIAQIESGRITGSAKTLAKLVKAITSIKEGSGVLKTDAVASHPVPVAVVSEPDVPSSKSASPVLFLSNLDLELINRMLEMKPKEKLKLLSNILGE